MEQRRSVFCNEVGAFGKSPLPSPALLIAQQQEQQQLSARVIETLNLVLQKHEALAQRTNELRKELELIRQVRPTEFSEEQMVGSSKLLMDMLAGNDVHFVYSLELAENLANPLCKGKYFDLKVRLSGPEPLLPLDVALELVAFTSEAPPHKVLHNMTGGPMIRGERQTVLLYDPETNTSEAVFKIQLNEVTSHFRNGWIFLVVQPVTAQSTASIRPLILDKVVIKAKESTCQRWRRRLSQDD
jgi:hypothetical protein